MRQQTFSSNGFDKFHKKTRKEQFLETMDALIPWKELTQTVEPFYPNPQGGGRRPIGIERMLRIHFLQHWFNLSDPAAEEALQDTPVFRQFAGIDLGREPAPDEMTLCKFRHLLEAHGLGERLFQLVNSYLGEDGLVVGRGTIVDATLVSAPDSTKNRDRRCDPEMASTRKGTQWYFGMKAHVGVDSRTQLIHSVATTPANVHDSQVLCELLHGKETRVWGDAAYAGQGKVLAQHAPVAQDFTQKKECRYRKLMEVERAQNRTKSKVRSKVEHSIGYIKRWLGFSKVRYRGLARNENRLFVACALSNMMMARRTLLKRRELLQGSYA